MKNEIYKRYFQDFHEVTEYYVVQESRFPYRRIKSTIYNHTFVGVSKAKMKYRIHIPLLLSIIQRGEYARIW